MKRTAAAALFAFLLLVPGAFAAGNPEVAALQVGLRQRGFYLGTVDGVLGPGTVSAVRRLQQRARLTVDGVPGPRTKRALGRFGRRPPLGGRLLIAGTRGWDVAALQFAMASHGFPSGILDGHFGAATERALRTFQRWAGLGADGIAGPGVFSALRAAPPACPISLSSPVAGRLHRSLRSARQPLPHGDRLPRCDGNSSHGRGGRASRVRRLQRRWLGEPRDDCARVRHENDVRPPVSGRRSCRPVRRARPADRPHRVERPLDGAAPALRGPRARRRGRSPDRPLVQCHGLPRELEVEACAGRLGRLVA